MSRIELTDTTMDVLIKMADGNPGAFDAMMNVLEKHDAIDPQAMMGGIGAIMMLDTFEIYGSDIYILYSDKCGRDVRKMLMIMRSCQMGNFSHEKLKQMAADQCREIDLTAEEWQEHDDFVTGRLEHFAKAA
jgi:hypothetical protein